MGSGAPLRRGWASASLLVVHEGTPTSAASPRVLVIGNGDRHGTFLGHESKSSPGGTVLGRRGAGVGGAVSCVFAHAAGGCMGLCAGDGWGQCMQGSCLRGGFGQAFEGGDA